MRPPAPRQGPRTVGRTQLNPVPLQPHPYTLVQSRRVTVPPLHLMKPVIRPEHYLPKVLVLWFMS